MKYPGITLGKIEAVWNKLGGEEGVESFLRGEFTVSKPDRRWREEDGVIFFTLTSDGTTGPQWEKRLKKKDVPLSKWARDVLNSPDFVATNGVTYEIAVLKGTLFSDDNRTTGKIHAEADRRNLKKPNAEVACLILDAFTKEEMKAMDLWWIVVMHEPIKGSDGDPCLLYVRRDGDSCSLFTFYGTPDFSWFRDDGFAFVVSQVSLGS